MNKFELYCLIFYALNADWEDTKVYNLGQFLSSMNPFQFKEITSAVPDVYLNYYEFMKKFDITIEYSYEMAKKYIDYVNIPEVTESFSTLEKSQWDGAVQEYMKTEHKGSGVNGDVPYFE